MREVSAYRYSSGVSWQSGFAGEGDWQWLLEWLVLGSVLLELYIQLKPSPAPGFSLETPTLSNPHSPPTFTFTIYPNGGAGLRNETSTKSPNFSNNVTSHCVVQEGECNKEPVALSRLPWAGTEDGLWFVQVRSRAVLSMSGTQASALGSLVCGEWGETPAGRGLWTA